MNSMIGAAIVLLVAISTATMTTVSDDVADIERDARALELFLKDKKDFKKYCPELDWDQPNIDTYKRDLKSQLPEKCKK
tara:strand:+ start:3305 stop:3541 length:237 start_codon:yes stop_codon:yes gene_type:complete